MLNLDGIEVVYLNVIFVLRGITLQVDDGIIVALLGANGAGKSTALKAISGLLKTEQGRVSHGSINFDGQRIDQKSAVEIAKLRIIQVQEGQRLFEHLTVDQNLKVGASQRTDSSNIQRDMRDIYEYFPRLKSIRRQVSGYISGGERQMLVIGRALMTRPRMLLLDEPSLGLAPMLVKEVFGIIKRINEDEGISILLVEQNARAALNLAKYGYVMENGRIVLDGPADKLATNEDVREFYMGLSQVGERKSYREVKHYKRRKRWLS